MKPIFMQFFSMSESNGVISMDRFTAPIAQQIWDMKYRLKTADGTIVDTTVQDTWRRIADDLASVEKDPGYGPNDFTTP